MQVATLFRETATLLGASMEAQDSSGTESQALKLSVFSEGAMKQEPHDDGYETSGDLELRPQGDTQKLLNHHIQNTGNIAVKCEPPDDPYSFVDDDPTPMPQPRGHNVIMQAIPKKRGRKKKINPDEGPSHSPPDWARREGEQIERSLNGSASFNCSGITRLEDAENLLNGDSFVKKKLKEEKFVPIFKERKKHDRFNGMPEEEVSKRTLPDHLALNLDIVIIGINPGLFAAYKGHHYAGPGNHFWKCLYLSGLTPEPMTADDDYKLLQVGIGFTNMVARATKGSADLTRKEIKEGSQILLEKLQKYKPKIAVFNGKLIFEVFSGKKDFSFGRQPDFVDGTNTYMWVMPSSSARCAQLPRAADKVPFYAALKKFRDYLNGIIADLDETEVVFTDSKLKNYFEPELKEEPKEEHAFYAYGRLPTNGELTDLSNAIVKKDEQPPAKKKRGRPKKIKSDCIEVKKVGNEILRKEHDVCGTPKKKRGRPKKIKTDDLMTNSNGLADHTKSSAPIPNCFSPPIQSPINFGQQNLSTSYNNQPLGQSYPQNQSHSPSDAANYHQSPIQSHHYSHSPQPSQPFTHSDLSSEISAAISSEHNLGSPSPTSPSIGPPDFEPPTSMPEETSDGPQNSSRTGKEEIASDNPQNPNECRFSSPTPSNDTSSMTYQNYGYPNGSQYNGSSSSNQNSYSPHFTTSSTNYSVSTSNSYSLHHSSASMNFSVTSLANSSASVNHDVGGQVSSSFSVSSLASNYASMNSNANSYSNLMGASHPMGSHMMGGTNAMFGSSMSGGIMERACGMGSSMSPLTSPVSLTNPMGSMNSLPYPYGQYSHGASSYSSTPAGGFPYTPTHSLHMPSPNYPYPSPYSNSTYPQSSYLPNHMLDRIKQDRMDISFGGF
ncbi:uncharacterized protein Tdg isoform X2 [Periplaneta americana]|uniref:uncharacterized protein Tdg isoform X2 n=1 Tax=Periplaneta americana TaxID=6978 RepID=UPI0037E9AA37